MNDEWVGGKNILKPKFKIYLLFLQVEINYDKQLSSYSCLIIFSTLK